MEIFVRANILSDSSETFDIIINDGQSSVTIPTICFDQRRCEKLANKFHELLEEATGQHVPWNDTMAVPA